MSIATEISRITSNIAAAYTALKAKGATIPTNQTSGNLATAISSITVGETVDWTAATAGTGDVLSGKKFYSGNSTVKTGTMTNKSGTTQAATASLDTTNSRVQMTVPATGKYSTSSKLYATYATIRTLIGLTSDKIVKGNTILGIAGTTDSMSGNAIYLLNRTDKCTSITGGWGAGYNSSWGVPLQTDDGLLLYDKTNYPSTGWYGTTTIKKIDVTNLANITIMVYSPNHYYLNYYRFGLYENRSDVYTNAKYNHMGLASGASYSTFSGSGANDPLYKTAVIDVSGITGSYYIGFYYYDYLNHGGIDHYGIITKVIAATLE